MVLSMQHRCPIRKSNPDGWSRARMGGASRSVDLVFWDGAPYRKSPSWSSLRHCSRTPTPCDRNPRHDAHKRVSPDVEHRPSRDINWMINVFQNKNNQVVDTTRETVHQRSPQKSGQRTPLAHTRTRADISRRTEDPTRIPYLQVGTACC